MSVFIILYHIPNMRERERLRNTIFYWVKLDLGLFYAHICEIQMLNKGIRHGANIQGHSCSLEFKLKCTYIAMFAPCFQLVFVTLPYCQTSPHPTPPPTFHYLRNEKIVLIHAITNTRATWINQLLFSHKVACLHNYYPVCMEYSYIFRWKSVVKYILSVSLKG